MQIIMLFIGALFVFVIVYKSNMYPFQTWYDIWGSQYDATALIPFAAALSYLLTPGVGKMWEQVQRQWIRISWFFMSVTLVLGGAWIYKLAQ